MDLLGNPGLTGAEALAAAPLVDGKAFAYYKKFYINFPFPMAVALCRGRWKKGADKAPATRMFCRRRG